MGSNIDKLTLIRLAANSVCGYGYPGDKIWREKLLANVKALDGPMQVDGGLCHAFATIMWAIDDLQDEEEGE